MHDRGDVARGHFPCARAESDNRRTRCRVSKAKLRDVRPSKEDMAEVRATKREKDEIRAYVKSQAHEDVVHLEKAASELVGPVRHDIWDVHCAESRWWVVTNPTNLYDREDFKSRDVVLTFHIGLMMRVQYARNARQSRPIFCQAPGGAGSRRSRHTTAAMKPRRFSPLGSGCGNVWSPLSEKSVGTIWCRTGKLRRRHQTSKDGLSYWPTFLL